MLASKTCFKCNKTKAISEFYKHSEMADGFLNKCKECTKSDVKVCYQSNRTARSLYEQKRNSEPGRRAAKRACERNYRLNNPEKTKARQRLNNAVRDGKICRWPCEVCGHHKTQAHHHDYSLPLDVRWLCFKCHREIEHGQVVVSSHE